MNCHICQKPLAEEVEAVEVFGIRIRPVCDECMEKRKPKIASNEDSRREYFGKICPAIYQSTDVAQLPDSAALQTVLDWKFGPTGFIAHGSSGAGKTRSVWLLLQRMVLEHGLSVYACTAGEFARNIGEAYGTSGEAGKQLFSKMCRQKILFIDDFGKFKATERVEDELFDVIEHRTRAGLPIILTTNGTKESLAAAFSPDRYEPIFRRLREFCKFIKFTHATKQSK